MATARIASWTTSLDGGCLDPEILHAALRALYNYLGCAINGSNHPSVQKVLVVLEPFFGYHTSSIFGTIHRTDAQHAALINGIASHVHDYDDTHLATIIHPTSSVASALFAYVQHISAASGVKVSGQQVLTAFVAGVEVECKLGLAVYPRHYDTGWHITSTTGAIGAAVAVAKLMQLSESQLIHAIGNAASQVIGLRCNFGSDTKPFHAGRAAQTGLLAALLARQGFTSSNTSIEASRGWANVVTGGLTESSTSPLDISEPSIQAKLTTYLSDAELGTVWEIQNTAFKPYPCGIVAHPAIDAAIKLRTQIIDEGVRSQKDLIQKLRSLHFKIHVHPLVVELTSNPTPRNGLEAKFSVHHGVAVGLLWGKAGPAEYEDEVVTTPEVIDIRALVEICTDKQTMSSDACLLEAFDAPTTNASGDYPPSPCTTPPATSTSPTTSDPTPTNSSATSTSATAAAAETTPTYTIQIPHATGSLADPMTDEMLEWKFVEQVRTRHGRRKAEEMSEACWKLGEAEDVNEILIRLVP